MKYEVVVTADAQADMQEAYESLVAQSTQHGPIWYNNLIEALISLEHMPTRHPVASESADSPEIIRQYLHGNKKHAYRVLFSIRGQNVMVLHVRHAARFFGA